MFLSKDHLRQCVVGMKNSGIIIELLNRHSHQLGPDMGGFYSDHDYNYDYNDGRVVIKLLNRYSHQLGPDILRGWFLWWWQFNRNYDYLVFISRLIPDLGQVTENRVDFSGTMVWPNLMMMAMVIKWKRGMIGFFQTHLKAATANSFVTAGVVRLEYWRKRTITNFSWRTGWFLVYWLEVDDPLTYIVSTKKTLPTCIFKYK